MIQNTIKKAEFRLEQHKSMGKKSTLSVFEVAQLMDVIKFKETLKKSPYESLFFSLGLN